VYAGGRITHTRQSPTLFVTNLDPSVCLESVAALFSAEPGFIAFRTVRRMCFIDYASVHDANAAMRKRQNHRFTPDSKPMLIDYDKDSRDKRDRQFTKQVAREIDEQEDVELVELSCSACSAFVLKLRILSPRCFAKLPRRPVDSAVVVDTAKHLVEMQLIRGEERAIRREAGVEMQYRLCCRACKLPCAYASTPFDERIVFLFLMTDALRGERKEIKQGKVVRTVPNFDLTERAATAAAAAAPSAVTAAAAGDSGASAPAASSSVAASIPADVVPTAAAPATAAAPSGDAAPLVSSSPPAAAELAVEPMAAVPTGAVPTTRVADVDSAAAAMPASASSDLAIEAASASAAGVLAASAPAVAEMATESPHVLAAE
jgi:hypothetical protein